MTIAEAVERIDTMVRNTYTREEKMFWLSNLDAQIATFILRTDPPLPYESEQDDGALLLAWPPYDMMYIHWLEAQIAYANGEIDRYNNAISVFQKEYDTFSVNYSRKNPPKNVTTIKYF